MPNQRDVEYMAYAVQLAKRGRFSTRPNPNVGCVIVDTNQKIVGEGFHKRAGEAHAEINALMQAEEKASGATAYVTLEPCNHQGKTGPCVQALLKAGVARVVVGALDPNPLASGGLDTLREHGVKVLSGILSEQCEALNRGFNKRMQTGLPWVTIKTALSLDGRSSLKNGVSKWITSEAARHDVQRLRASHDAIMTGIGTVLADNPSLTVRLTPDELKIEGEVPQPIRVIMDSELKCPTDAKLLSHQGYVMIYTCSDNVFSETRRNCKVTQVAGEDGRVSLGDVFKDLASKEVNSVLVEAGPQLLGSLCQQGFVDEFIIYLAPKLLGTHAQGMANLGELISMDQQVSLEFKDVRSVGKDLKITACLMNQ